MNRVFRKALLICTSSLLLASAGLHAEESEHPQDKPLIVGSDFGVAPWIMRGTNGPEGFGVDLVSEISKRLKRPGAEIVDVRRTEAAAEAAPNADMLPDPERED